MICNQRTLVRFIACLSIAGFIFGCSDEEIPSTPSAPFLFNAMLVTKNTTPTLFTPLARGQVVSFKVGVAYTLAPSEAANIRNLSLSLDFDNVDSLGSFIQEIGKFPDSTMAITSAAASLVIPISVTMPGGGTPSFVRLTAAIADTAATAASEDKFWPLP